MKIPALQNEAFLAEVLEHRSQPRQLSLWWLGQSGFLVQFEGRHVLIDPYLSDSLTKKYAGTDKPHDRMTEMVIDPARLDFIDVVTSSHNHTDHLDADTLLPLFTANPGLQMIVPAANHAFVATRLNLDATRFTSLVSGQSVSVNGITFHGIPAAHNALDTDEQGRHLFMGYVIEFGRWKIYHSGDTLRFDGLAEQLRPFDLDVALLPINGDLPERRVAGNLDGPQAAQLASDIGARVVIPCHYDMFEFNTVSPHDFVEACGRLRQHYKILENGERWSVALM
ncbi:MAG: MBL fold metallo-hydrolase [Opitutaceae bacterium]|nr:MBL fold metallo-hydrolase [Verrucomicrobiales bacterium]